MPIPESQESFILIPSEKKLTRISTSALRGPRPFLIGVAWLLAAVCSSCPEEEEYASHLDHVSISIDMKFLQSQITDRTVMADI